MHTKKALPPTHTHTLELAPFGFGLNFHPPSERCSLVLQRGGKSSHPRKLGLNLALSGGWFLFTGQNTHTHSHTHEGVQRKRFFAARKKKTSTRNDEHVFSVTLFLLLLFPSLLVKRFSLAALLSRFYTFFLLFISLLFHLFLWTFSPFFICFFFSQNPFSLLLLIHFCQFWAGVVLLVFAPSLVFRAHFHFTLSGVALRRLCKLATPAGSSALSSCKNLGCTKFQRRWALEVSRGLGRKKEKVFR